MAANLVENDVELAALAWFQALDYSVVHGPHIAPCEPAAERDSFGEVVLAGRLREATRRLNPVVPEEARDCAVSVNTIRNWMAVLQASHQVFLLPAWPTNLSKRLYTTPKVHFLDTGLCAYLTEWTSPATLEAGAMSGAILESYAVSEVLKSWWHRGKDASFYHYRDKDAREIDLLIACDGRLYPLEIKKAATVGAADASAFGLLGRRGAQPGDGAVLSLCAEAFPLSKTSAHVPLGWL